MPNLTLIVPYYRNAEMLAEQCKIWNEYPHDMQIIVVDDGSPEPAKEILEKHLASFHGIRLFRIEQDIPWNRGGARNVGSKEADTEWLMHIDIDHVLPAECTEPLLTFKADEKRFYRFPRFRRGAADETRMKDALDRNITYGPVKPHGDSFIVSKEQYWKIGGYDEDYSGCLGGGSPFQHSMEKRLKADLLPSPIHLEVYTRSVIKDASDFSLNRDTSEYSARRKKKEREGNTVAKNPFRFDYKRVL